MRHLLGAPVFVLPFQPSSQTCGVTLADKSGCYSKHTLNELFLTPSSNYGIFGNRR